jgi:hypothetical protein
LAPEPPLVHNKCALAPEIEIEIEIEIVFEIEIEVEIEISQQLCIGS